MAAAAGLRPNSAAALLAPAVVGAVDGGRADAAAAMLQLLFAAHMQALLMWLLEAIVRGTERTDAAAAVAWHAVQKGGAGAQRRERLLAAHSELAASASLMPWSWECPCPPGCTSTYQHLPDAHTCLAAVLPSAVMPAAVLPVSCAVMVGDSWALLAVDGRHQTAADLAGALYDHQPGPASRQQVLGDAAGPTVVQLGLVEAHTKLAGQCARLSV